MALICGGVLFSKSLNAVILLRWSIRYIKWRILIWFRPNPRNLNPRNFQFLVGFSFVGFTHCTPTVIRLKSKDVEYSCASFGLCEYFARVCPSTQTPTQKFKSGFLIFNSQGIGLSLVSLISFWNYGVYSIIKQKAFEGGLSRALICMNFQL